MGLAINKEDCQTLAAYDGSLAKTSRSALVEVSLGDTQFKHKFCITPLTGSKMIFGNELLKAQQCSVNPAEHNIILFNKRIIPCHVVVPKENKKEKEIYIKKVTEDVKIITTNDKQANYDLYSSENVIVNPGR